MNDPGNQREQCAVCGKEVSNGWFARLRNDAGWAKLCSPKCAMRYYESLRSADDVGLPPPEPRDGRCHFFFHGECWS
jgi:hypothetical protein